MSGVQRCARGEFRTPSARSKKSFNPAVLALVGWGAASDLSVESSAAGAARRGSPAREDASAGGCDFSSCSEEWDDGGEA